MKLFLKDKKTFTTKAALDCYKYTLVKSIYTDLSELTIEYSDLVERGDILIDNNSFLGVISDFERDTPKTLQVKTQDIATLFSRPIIYQGDAESMSAERYLEKYLYEEYGGDQADSYYMLPYVSVNRVTNSSVCLPDIEYGLWNCKSYISRIRRLYNIYTDCVATYNAGRPVIQVNIEKKTIPNKTIFTTNRNVEILEETFGNTVIAKITAYTRGDNPTANDYYMTSSGTYTTNRDDPTRITGDWEYIEISDDQNEQEQVLNKFKENTYSHKVSFLLPNDEARYDFYDPITLELRGQYYSSYIAKKILHDDGTTEYQCGELRTSLSDKINKIL